MTSFICIEAPTRVHADVQHVACTTALHVQTCLLFTPRSLLRKAHVRSGLCLGGLLLGAARHEDRRGGRALPTGGA